MLILKIHRTQVRHLNARKMLFCLSGTGKCFSCCITRVIVIFEVRNFLAPNPEICEVPGENHLGKIIFESIHIYPVLNDLEVSRNVI